MQMKAWVLHGIGDFRLEEAKKPEPGDGEVLVAVKAAGICGSDIPRIYRTGAYSYPLIPGHEFSGVVTEAGRGADAAWINKRVGVFPLIPCGVCQPCRKKAYEMCRHYSYTGSRRDGAFAEYVVVPAKNLIELPESVSFEEGAMLEPMAVAVHAMRRAVPGTGDIAAVCGLGTIGTLLLMFLLEAGVKDVFVFGNKEFQRQAVLKMGLPESRYCDSRDEAAGKWFMEQMRQAESGLEKESEGRAGADVFFECVGRNETVLQAVNLSAPGGRICLVGNPYGDMAFGKDVYWKILRNQLTVTGTWNSSFLHGEEDDWHYVLSRLAEKRIAPAGLISHRLTMEELGKGTIIMRDKTEDYMKIMVSMQ